MQLFLFTVCLLSILSMAESEVNDVISLTSCDDTIGKQICELFRKKAAILKEDIAIVNKAVHDLLVKGVKDTTKIIESLRQLINNKAANFHCTKVLPANICAKIKILSEKFGIPSLKVKSTLLHYFATGITKMTDLYNAVVQFIISHWKGSGNSNISYKLLHTFLYQDGKRTIVY